MKYFLDTNIIIYALNGKYPLIEQHFASVPSQSIVIPTIVLAEIEYGARKSKNYAKTIKMYNQFTSVFEKIPFSERASEYYGVIRSNLETKGQLIGSNDLIIASIVLAEKGILVTNNTKEFSRIQGLQIENWTE